MLVPPSVSRAHLVITNCIQLKITMFQSCLMTLYSKGVSWNSVYCFEMEQKGQLSELISLNLNMVSLVKNKINRLF